MFNFSTYVSLLSPDQIPSSTKGFIMEHNSAFWGICAARSVLKFSATQGVFVLISSWAKQTKNKQSLILCIIYLRIMSSNFVIKLDNDIGTDDSYILCIFKSVLAPCLLSGLSFFNLASQVKIAVFAHRKEDLTIKSTCAQYGSTSCDVFRMGIQNQRYFLCPLHLFQEASVSS